MTKLREDITQTDACRYGIMTFFRNDIIISRCLREYGEWAQAEIDFLDLLIKPGTTVLDVGAYIGTHTLAFARKVGDAGRVYSFEPHPLHFELLQLNIEQNGLSNVTLVNQGVSDAAKDLAICATGAERTGNFASFSLLESDSCPDNRLPHRVVTLTTIDQLSLNDCALIKIDAENMELPILKGARRTLTRVRPIIFAECNSLQYSWPLVEFCKKKKYRSLLLNSPAYNPNNFRHNPANFLGHGREASLLLVPLERLNVVCDQLADNYRSLVPIDTIDDLALGLLKKPQYKQEILSTRKAAKILGTTFWANEPELRDLQGAIRAGEDALSQKVAELVALHAHEAQMVGERDSLSASHERTVRELSDKIERIATERIELTRTYEDTMCALNKERERSTALTAQYEETTQQLRSSHEETVRTLIEVLQKNSADLASSKICQAHLQSSLDKSDQELTSLKLEQERLMSEIKYLTGQHERLTLEASGLLDKCQQLTTDNLALSAQLSSKSDAYQTLDETYQIKTAVLDAIMRSHGWKAMSSYYKMREALLPAGSARRRLATYVVRVCKMMSSPAQSIQLIRDKRLIGESGLFSHGWYLRQYPDVASSGVDPIEHYLRYGASEARDPNQYFDSDWYLQQNPDVANAGTNPLVHYIRKGAEEGRDPGPLFNSKQYRQNPLVTDSGLNPLAYYLRSLVDEAVDRLDVVPPINTNVANSEATGFGPGGPPSLAEGSAALEARADKSIQVVAADTSGINELSNTYNVSASGPTSVNVNTHDYEALVSTLAVQRRSRVAQLDLTPPELISIRDLGMFDPALSIELRPSAVVDTSIIIPVFGELQYTLECLLSIARYTSDVSYEVIVVDDCSADNTPTTVPKVKNIVYLRNETNLGFIRSCNRGASEARGKYLIFLNNDAQVTSGWLSTLIETFHLHSRVGAVGPKVLYPDGRLQEAGAMVNRDGTSTLIGLFDDPQLARFNSLREVVYCSGVCLLVEKEVFLKLGGFDESFAPAYCEDCDLSFRLRRVGLRVIYNPDSVIYHHLSVTARKSFKNAALVRNQQKLVERWQREIDELNDVKLIAFYLPQFHPTPENDQWWGKGFTEWTNVTKARPNFLGHYQPHLPADLGFYDLRLPEAREQQAKLAKRYGIFGFCYYYYWFAGKRLLDQPLERMLQTNNPDMPFCIAWANENWTRKWDGQEHAILIAQQHSDDDDRAVMSDLIRYLRRPNYIRINGKPLLIIYRPSLFPNIKGTIEIWRDQCLKEGVGQVYLVLAESFELARTFVHPSSLGFDASVEFPPHSMSAPVAPPGKIINPEFSGVLHDYRQIVEDYLRLPMPGHVRFRSVMPGWDNTPRRQNDPVMFVHASAGAYQAWLEAIIDVTREQNFGDERLVFINAWNEWAEGNHLEPDQKHGHAYLEATRNARDSWLVRQPAEI